MNQTEKALRDSLMGETGPGSFKTNWMVEAGAGAGKTHIIAWRIVRQLISGHCQPDQLVAITFTNKATNELQDRVTQYLRKERDNCSQAAKRERLTALYRAAGAMQISTIHGFCQSMLQEMPVQAGLNLESTLLDEEETSAYYREVYRRIQQEHVDCFAPLERYGIPAKLLDDLFQAAVRSPEQSIPYDWEDSKEYKDTQKALIDAGEALRQKLHGEFDHCQPQLYGDWLRQALSVPPIQTVDAALSLSRQLDLLLRPQDFVQKIRSGRIKEDGKPDRKEYPLNGLVCEDTTLHTVWSYYLDLLKQCRELEKKLEKERQKKRQTDTVKATIQQLEQEVHDLQNKLAEEKKHPAWEMVNAELNILLYIGEENKLAQAAAPLYYTVLMETLTQCLEWAREDKDRKNLLTYDDLLLRTRNLLRDCPEARRRFHQRYPVIYVDEFQDTDPIQAQILFYLTTSEQAFSVDWTKCRPEAGSLFLVGDPKQSIYRFRGADLSIYQTVRSIFQRENAVNPAAFAIAELHTNFRSTQPICNQITQLFQDKLDGRDGQAAFLAMEATEEKEALGGMYAWRAANAEACAQQVAAFIEQAVRDKKAQFGDFLVLTPRRRPAGIFYAALRERGIPVELSGETEYGLLEPIRRLAIWCNLLLHSGDDIARMQVLQTCFGVRPVELYALEQQTNASLRELFAKKQTVLDEMESTVLPNQKSLLRAVKTVRQVMQMTTTLAPMALLEELVQGEYGVWPNGVRQEDVYGWVCQYLETLRNYSCQTLHGLLQKAVHMAEYGTAERQLTLEETENCVRVMNLHKAKGLEGRIVILACDKRSRPPRKRITYNGSLWFSIQEFLYDEQGNPWKLVAQHRKWKEAEAEEIRQEQMERERLYYVAATRAEQALLVCQLPLKKGNVRSEHDFWGTLDLPIVEDTTKIVGCSAKPLLEPQDVSGQLVDDKVRLPDENWDRQQKKAASHLPPSSRQAITPSGLNHPAPPVRGADEDAVPWMVTHPAEDSEELESGAAFSPHGADWGTIMHRTLELAVGRQAWANAERMLCARQAVEEVFPPTVPLTAQQRMQLFDQQVPESYEEMVEHLCAAVMAASGFLACQTCELRRCLEQGTAWTELPFFLQVADQSDPLYGHIAAYAKENTGKILDVQGIIDLAIETPDGWMVVDYKTDRLRPGESEAAYCQRLCSEYTPQIQSYVLMLQRLGMGTVLGAWLCSIPLNGKLLPLPMPNQKTE